MELRPNQIEPSNIGVSFFQKKKADPSIIVCPTAFGKSIVIAYIAKHIDDKVLILQPSKELLQQNFSKFTRMGGVATIYSASVGIKQIGHITYATIGSIKGIGTRFKELGFTKMIIDECHLYPREMDSMIGRFLQSSGITHVLGLTATPLKLQSGMGADGNPMSKLVMLTSRSKKGNFFKDIIHVSQVKEMVELKFWSPLEYETYHIDEGKLVYNSTKAEYTEESIKAVYESNDIRGKLFQKIADLKDRKSIIVFVPSVDEAIRFAQEVEGGAAVYGNMDKKERDFVVSGFLNGSIRIIFNVNVLSVGFDHPGLDCIIMARSTASFAWYYQALGRGTRIHPNKEDCLIVDFSGNVKRFGRIEDIYFTKEKQTWKLYGEAGNLLTGCPIHEIGLHKQPTEPDVVPHDPIPTNPNKVITFTFGMHKGKKVSDVPKGYREWALENVTWTDRNHDVKVELERLREMELENNLEISNQ